MRHSANDDAFRFQLRPMTIAIILIGLLAGLAATLVAALLSALAPEWKTLQLVTLNIGCGLIATAFITATLDLVWSRQRGKEERDRMQPMLDRFDAFERTLNQLEGRLEAFKKLGLNHCHLSRRDALQNFLRYAQETVTIADHKPSKSEADDDSNRRRVNIVSSSARGLIGELDGEAKKVQNQWRELISKNPKHFRLLLTHPAYAHLRQPAEKRSSGDIELEVLKAAIYLHCVAGMKSTELRFYRGSPTVFMIHANEHVLLNPYPYGRMAMDTLCLEFEGEAEDSYVADFVSMHFHQPWAFKDRPGKEIDGKPLVEGVDSIESILDAFGECTFLSEPKRLRLTLKQVAELDVFISTTISQYDGSLEQMPEHNAFMQYAEDKGFTFADGVPDIPHERAALPQKG